MNECAQSAGASDKGIPQDQERFQRVNDQVHEYAPKASGVVENQTAVPGHQEGGLLKKLLTTTTKKKDVLGDQQAKQPAKTTKRRSPNRIRRPMNGFFVSNFMFNSTTKKKDVVADQQANKQTIQPTKTTELKEAIHIKRPMNGFMVGHFFSILLLLYFYD